MPGDRGVELVELVERQVVDVRGWPTPVQVGGRGRPLLFLHGEGNTSAWGEVHEALARDFTVYAPVAPGFGGTEVPDWLDDVEDLSFHHLDLLGALGVRAPIVLGVSLGGWMALDLAVRRSDLLAGLVLVGALGLRPAEPMADLFLLPAPEALGYLSAGLDAAAVDPLTGSIDAATALWAEQGAQARLMWERPYDRRLGRRLHHVTCPALVLWGGGDRLLPPSHGHELARALGLDEAVVLEGAGHLATVDAPGEIAALTSEFAQRIDVESTDSANREPARRIDVESTDSANRGPARRIDVESTGSAKPAEGPRAAKPSESSESNEER